MFKKAFVLIFSIFLLANTCGCVALLAGGAASAGTAVWLSEKMSQQVNASFEKSIRATREALKSLKLEITKETVKENVAQIMSNYTDGKTIWIDIRKIANSTSKIDVRVGLKGDQDAAAGILAKIIKYL